MNWIICFCESKNDGLWRLFTFWRKGFGHVFAVKYDPQLDAWMKFECSSGRFDFVTYTGEAATNLVFKISTECVCVETQARSNPIQLPRWLYCVSFVKHIVGCNKAFILTPYQLYCELIKNNGQIIFGKYVKNP